MNTTCNFSLGHALDRKARLLAISLFGGFGIFSNIFVIILAVKYIPRKNIHDWIINMAIADCMLSFVVIFREINNLWDLKELNHRYVEFCCYFLMSLIPILTMVSLISMLIISIERYRATRSSLRRIQAYTLQRGALVLLSSWMFSGLFSVYNPLQYQVKEDKKCVAFPSIALSVWAAAEDCFFFFSLFALVLLNCLTLHRLTKTQPIHQSMPEQQRQQRKQRIAQVVRMVLCSLVVYSLCYIPLRLWNSLMTLKDFNAFEFPDRIDGECIDYMPLFFIVFNFFPSLNSCISPYIYIACLPDFRKAANKLLCKTRAQQDREMGNMQDGIPSPVELELRTQDRQ